MSRVGGSQSLLIIQCDSGHLDTDLLACAKYRVDDIREEKFRCASGNDDIEPFNGCCHVLFTVLIPREHNKSSFVGFLGGEWICSHIDDFCPAYNFSPFQLALSNTPFSSLFYSQVVESRVGPVNYCQNLYKLIPESVHRASCDPNSAIAKRSHKINSILYHLLTVHPPMKCGKCKISNSYESNFISCIAFYVQLVDHIWNYIKKREPHETWLIDASLDQNVLQQGGAFLQVLLHKLDKVIINSFAEIIAFIDQANNLSLIDPTREVHPDVQEFWIAAFGDFGYNSKEKCLKERSIQTQALLYDHGCTFPFFWVIQQTVDKIIKDCQHLMTG